MKQRWHVLAALLVLASGGAAQSEPQQKSARSLASASPPELAAFQADVSEEETVRRLQQIALRKRGLLERAEVRGQAYVRLVRLGLLPLSEGFEGFVSHANRVESLRRGLARDLAEVARLDDEATQAKFALRQLRARRDNMVRQLNDYQRSRSAIIAAREREDAYRRAFETGTQDGHTAVYVAKTDADGAQSFSEIKGHLPFPVEGRAEVIELEPDDNHGTRVELRVERGAVARAVYKGRVVLVGDSEDGQRVVIVEHGGGYSTVYANLQRVLVKAGDDLAAGAEIGELGFGSDGRAVLVFEVRHEGTSLLPAEWLGI